MIKNIIALILLVFLSSCVPTKDLIYLQGKPVSAKEIKRINNEPYKLQVDDVINIDIKAIDEKLVRMYKKSGERTLGNQNVNQSFTQGGGYFSGYRIDGHGNIRIPVLGELNVLGYTTKEVRLKLEEALRKDFLHKEDLFVTVKLAGLKYTVIGEVRSPGPKVVYKYKLNIIDAITNSGDISSVGNRKKIEVIRKTLAGRKKYYIDITKAAAFESEVFYIQPHDIINIYPLPQKALGVGTTGFQALSTAVSVLSLLTSLIIIAKNI